LLLRRYHSLDYVNNLYWAEGIEFINMALNKESEQKEWEMWLTLYPNMDKKTFISFEKFKSKKQIKTVAKKQSTTEDILAKAEELRLIHQGKHLGVVN
jgi:hypothetical protein